MLGRTGQCASRPRALFIQTFWSTYSLALVGSSLKDCFNRGSLSGILWQGVFLLLFALPGSWDLAVLDAVCAGSALWVPPGSSMIQPCLGLPKVNVWQDTRVEFGH